MIANGGCGDRNRIEGDNRGRILSQPKVSRRISSGVNGDSATRAWVAGGIASSNCLGAKIKTVAACTSDTDIASS
jgi:hypothetical protein